MRDRPLAKYESRQLWLDRGGVYEPVGRFTVLSMLVVMQSNHGPDARQMAQECRDALQQYEAAMEDAT